eukprot:382236_1
MNSNRVPLYSYYCGNMISNRKRKNNIVRRGVDMIKMNINHDQQKQNKKHFDTDESTKTKVLYNNCYHDLWKKQYQKQENKIKKLQIELNEIKCRNNELKMNLKMEQETFICEKNKFTQQFNEFKIKNNELKKKNNELKEEYEYQSDKINDLKIENNIIKSDIIKLTRKNEKKNELLNIDMGFAKNKFAKYSQLLIWGLPLFTGKI